MFFIPIGLLTIVGQILIVFFGGDAFQTVPITGAMWATSIVVGFVSLPIGIVIRLLPSWDGCTLCGRSVGVPDTSRVVMTKERLQWQHSIGQVRTQLQVFKALRGTSRMQLGGNSQEMQEGGVVGTSMIAGGAESSAVSVDALLAGDTPSNSGLAGSPGKAGLADIVQRVQQQQQQQQQEP